MKNLEIIIEEGANFKPYVFLNAETGYCELSGESYLEEAGSFYQPIRDWLLDYMKTGKSILFDFKLTYVNTGSSKHILAILRMLKEYEVSGADVKVNWYIEEGDTDTEEDIEDCSIISGIEINTIKVERKE